MYGTLSIQKDVQPFFFYERINLVQPRHYFIHQIDYGYWYLLRQIHVRYPEVDATGLIYGPRLTIEMLQRAANQVPQNLPIPVDLFTTPGMAGVTILPTGQMTAVPFKYAKKLNVVYPFRDTIEITVIGQDGTTPAEIDLMTTGYLVPARGQYQWEGVFNG